MSIYDQLCAEFPKEAISWRAQTLTQDGTKAMALAYIDARDVMDRLDEVVGFENWQDRYEFHGARTICYLSIRVNGEWITKADGAGDSDVEAEKGAISDALKRSAVKWGIGRYLYHLKSPWVPCESYEKGNKKYWKKWAGDPWAFVKGDAPVKAQATPKPKEPSKNDEARKLYSTLEKEARLCKQASDLGRMWRDPEFIALKDKLPTDWQKTLHTFFIDHGNELKKQNDTVKDIQDQFPGATVVSDRQVSTLEAL